MDNQKSTNIQRIRRRHRVRRHLRGTAARPRLSIFRSHKHTYAQVIDDEAGRTLVSAGSSDAAGYGGNKEAAKTVGRLLAERALAAGIKQVAFDRREYRYHGRVAAFADAAREAGLSF
jgi:large subunit ribosomal protein L18